MLGLTRVEDDRVARRVLERERIGVRGARPGGLLAPPVTEDRRPARPGEPHVVGVGSCRVDDLGDLPDLGLDDDDVRRCDGLIVDPVDVAHRLSVAVLPAAVRARLGLVLVFDARQVFAVGDDDVRCRGGRAHPAGHLIVLGIGEERPGRHGLRILTAFGRERLAHRRCAREHVVGAWAEVDAVVAARVIGREVDVLALRGIALDERHLVRRRTGVDERAPHHRRERPIGEAGAADVADGLRVLRLEHRRKARDEPFDEDLEDHVGLGDAVVRPGLGNVVDLDQQRTLVDRPDADRFPIERPAVPARGVRIGGAGDRWDRRRLDQRSLIHRG